MLRSIVGTRRLSVKDDSGNVLLEDWVDWMQRATHAAEAVQREHGVRDWVEEITRRSSDGRGTLHADTTDAGLERY